MSHLVIGSQLKMVGGIILVQLSKIAQISNGCMICVESLYLNHILTLMPLITSECVHLNHR